MQRIRQAGRFFLTGDRLLPTMFGLLLIYYGVETMTFFRTMSEDVVGPATFPRLLAILGGILVILFFMQQRHATVTEADEGAGMASEAVDLIPALFMLVYVLLLEQLGFLLATFLFIAATIRFLGEGWKRTILYSLGISISVFLIFYYGLLADLPMGTWVPTEDLLPFLVDIRRAIRS
jgi:putative tricarboxylic transport membrane protein